MADRELIPPLGAEALEAQFVRAEPFLFVVIEGSLQPSFAAEVAGACPTKPCGPRRAG
jgi:hypothetical protein